MPVTLPQNFAETDAEKTGAVIDHLVAALGGEPGCTLRRALVLVDIGQHPGTTQAGVMGRLGVNKSALNRDIEWLYDYGCLLRQPGNDDGRTLALHICGYAKKNLGYALAPFGGRHESLKNFLAGLINLFGQHKPTLRDAKIIAVIGTNGAASRQEILGNLYNGPATTENRAVNNLISFGLVQKE
jgi:hypothetical protein